jgi:hypothetical protein
MAEAFEYKTLKVSHIKGKVYESPEDALNELGAQGWEVFSIFHNDAAYVSEIYEIFYLKRKTVRPKVF